METQTEKKAVIYQIDQTDLKALFKEFLREAKTIIYDPHLFVGEDRLSQKEAAAFLEITVPTIITWRKTKDFPFLKVGKNRVIFSKKLLLQYMHMHKDKE